MPVSGLVLTLSPDLDMRSTAIERIVADPRVTLGKPLGGSLPAVTATDTMEDHEALWNELLSIEGVLMIRLAYHDFSDIEEFDTPRPPRRMKSRESERFVGDSEIPPHSAPRKAEEADRGST